MLISVVLPAPLGPSSAKISPRRISRLMSLRAWNPDAYILERLEIAMTGCMEVSSTKIARYARYAESHRINACDMFRFLGARTSPPHNNVRPNQGRVPGP